MNCLLVPTLGLDISLLERLAKSIDYPIRHKIIVNNGILGGLHSWWENGKHYDWSIWTDKQNNGVAGSWNKAPELFHMEPSWLIVNDDVEFHPGALGEFCRKVDELADKEHVIMWDETEWFSCFAWTRVGVERFGTFDENFWPAYEEDADMRMRWKIAGARQVNVFGKRCPLNHGKPKCGGPRYNKMIQEGAVIRRDYFKAKWGTMDFHKPVFKTPFNDPEMEIKEWHFSPTMREQLTPIWNEFISQPNPSIYK